MQALPPANAIRPSRWRAWLDGLCCRPFLWLAPAIVLGCVLGAQFAAWMRAIAPDVTRAEFFLRWPLLPIPFIAFLAWRWRKRHAFFCRLAASGTIILFFTFWAARRLLPPRGDVSELARAATQKPNTRVPVALQGWVADYPRRGDFGIEFPLECVRAAVTSDAKYSGTPSPRGGRVWLRAPRDADVGVGDALALQAELAVLPEAGNPGERELRSRYLLRSCWCVGRVKAKENIELLRRADRYPLAQTIAAARRRILQHYETAFSSTQRAYSITTAQLLTAMVFGEGGLRDPLPRQTRDAFRAAGMSHLLVASGSQIALCVALLLGGAHLLGLRRWWLVLLIAPVLIFYALVAGGAASIWRAAIAGVCLMAAIVMGRETDGLTLWSLALGVLLLLDPTGIFDLSLQLSFAAAWGLLALAPFLRALLARRFGSNALTAMVALTLGAQLATTPLSLFHFGRVSVVSLGVNFLGVPLAGVLVTTGLAGAFLPFMNGLNYALTTAIASVASTAARLPGAQLETPPVKLQWTLFCYTLLLLAAALPAEASWRENLDFLRAETARWWAQRRKRGGWWRPQTWIVLAVILLTVWAGWKTYGNFRKPSLLIAALDVGQGECLVVRAPSGRTVLIDGGTVSAPDRGDVGRSVIAPYLASLGVQKIDALIITHSDADHVNGLPFVLREVPVGLVIDGAWRGSRSTHAPGENAGEADYFALREQLRARHVPIHAATPGQRLNLGDGVVLRVLAPVEPFLNGANNNAAVLRLEFGQVSALFTGDIEKEAEERLVRRGLIAPCTILKVAHHGSKTSTSPLWLKAARPRAAVISAGRYNAFGHPAAQTLQRLAAAHIPVFRTDRQGAVEFRCDKSACRAQTYK